jgi:flagellar basal body-associated protein FliL
MADRDSTKRQDAAGGEAPPKKGTGSKVVPWLITGITIFALAGLGFFAGRLFGTRGDAQTVSAAESPGRIANLPEPDPTGGQDAGPGWYYDLESVIANLNEPGVTRYVRVGLTLEICSTRKQEEERAALDQKKPLLKDWLTLYLSNQTLEDIRGEKNLRRMQTQIADALNEKLFSGQAPRIKRVLFKELSIQ